MEGDRVERLLALLVLQMLKSSSMKEKALTLNIAGFSNVEIADLLQISPGGVAQSIYEARRAKGTRPKLKTVRKSKKP
jgi:hypothetical protein